MKDLNKRIEALPVEKRALLARLVNQTAESRVAAVKGDEASVRPAAHEPKAEYDVVIMGGGLAGLTLAVQLRRAVPSASILILEDKGYPAPEAAHKVGESSVEIGARYFHGVLGFREHLEQRQIRKMGLRFFFPYGDNGDLAKRVELGPFANHVLPIPSYQIDRGRFENMLAVQAAKEGAGFLDHCRVTRFQPGPGEEPHNVEFTRAGEVSSVKARWVIDASGRGGIIRRKLGLDVESEHNVNSAWIRIKVPIDLEKWSDDPEFRGRMLNTFRQYSTNHLLGRGYWVWLIRLASGSTSVGIVADPRLHPLSGFNQKERFIQWLEEHEPLAGNLVRERESDIQDFIAIKKLAYTTREVYSKDRWALIGDAALFTDPLYSLGSDFIGMGNTLVTELVRSDLAGDGFDERVDFFSWFYLDLLYDTGIRIFQDQYPIMGNAQVWTAKVVWDIGWYWATLGILFFHDKIADLEFLKSVKRELVHFQVVQRKMQDFFRAWDAETKDEIHTGAHVDLTRIEYVYPLLHLEMEARFDDETLRCKLRDNVSLLESVGAEMYRQAFGELPEEPMTDSGLTVKQHLERAATRADVRGQLRRCWIGAVREEEMAASIGVSSL